jgi:hypothetical protein
MALEQFTVQPPDSMLITIPVGVLIALGAFLVVTGFSRRLLEAVSSFSFGHMANKYVAVVAGIVLIVLGGGLLCVWYTPSTVTVDSGYMNVQFSGVSPDLPGVPFVSGNKNVTSDEIADAFVGQVGSGDFTLDKQYGSNAGDVNVGVFTLGNGATAYVATVNATNLIIELNSGQYVIVGNSNTQALADSFSQNVYPLNVP